MSLKHKYLDCSCSLLNHVIRITYFEDDLDQLYLEIVISNYPWYKRLWIGISYILGLNIRRSYYTEETVLDKNKIIELRDFLNEVLKN